MKINHIICLAPREILLTEGQKKAKAATDNMNKRTGELYQTIQITQTYADTIIRMKRFSHPHVSTPKKTQVRLNQHVILWQRTVKPSLGNCITELRGFYDNYITRYSLLKTQMDDADDIDKATILKYMEKVEDNGEKNLK